jgi:hypothetical protein
MKDPPHSGFERKSADTKPHTIDGLIGGFDVSEWWYISTIDDE